MDNTLLVGDLDAFRTALHVAAVPAGTAIGWSLALDTSPAFATACACKLTVSLDPLRSCPGGSGPRVLCVRVATGEALRGLVDLRGNYSIIHLWVSAGIACTWFLFVVPCC